MRYEQRHQLGMIVYGTYGEMVGQTHDGRELPTWSELGTRIQAAWIEAAMTARRIPVEGEGDVAGRLMGLVRKGEDHESVATAEPDGADLDGPVIRAEDRDRGTPGGGAAADDRGYLDLSRHVTPDRDGSPEQ